MTKFFLSADFIRRLAIWEGEPLVSPIFFYVPCPVSLANHLAQQEPRLPTIFSRTTEILVSRFGLAGASPSQFRSRPSSHAPRPVLSRRSVLRQRIQAKAHSMGRKFLTFRTLSGSKSVFKTTHATDFSQCVQACKSASLGETSL